MTEEKKTTEIQKITPEQALAHPQRLLLLKDHPIIMASLNDAWPGDLDPQRRQNKTNQLIGQAIISIAGSPARDKLTQSMVLSFVDSLVACASMDLSLNKALGEAYLVPFAGVCTLMVGYRGFIKLIVNTGFVTHIESVMVYEREEFTWTRDETGPHWIHNPDLKLQGQDEKVAGCYCVGYREKGPPIFEPMNLAQLIKVMKSSAAVKSGAKTPYDWWRTEMYRKAPIRRMQKWIPKTGENKAYELLALAIEHDNKMFDLKGSEKYIEAAEQHRNAVQEQREAEWQKRLTAEPEKKVEPEQKKEPERATDGQIIPESFLKGQDDASGD